MKTISLFSGETVLVDDEDHDFISQCNWYLNSEGYVIRKVKKKTIWMHREINKTPEDMFTDHINRDRLDNRKINLRDVTKSQNAMNSKVMSKEKKTSKYKGVHWHTRDQIWISKIFMNGKVTVIGYFKKEIEAAIRYNDAAIELFGEFANLNILEAA